MTDGPFRVEETPKHLAVREALANCLANADFYQSWSVVIEKYPDRIVMSNPGTIIPGKKQMLRGGISEPRNKSIFKMFNLIGPDTGYDAIHDLPTAAAGHRFFDRLVVEDRLAKTILYCLNPKDNELLTVMAYTFNDGTYPGKMQFGSGWWFLDQEDGMRKQLNSLSALGLLSRFVGMLTDSRSFISYPRHEYFRRILCDVLGKDVEDGKLPKSELPFIHQMVKDIAYNNAKNYFNF